MFINRSLRGPFKSSVLLMAVLGLCSSKGWSADSVSFSESQKDTVKCTADLGCDTFTTGKFSGKALVFTGVDPKDPAVIALLDPGTDVSISVGGWSFFGTLGDDPKYVAGGKKAKFNLTHQKCNDNTGVCKDVTHGTISLAVTSKGLAVNISMKTGFTLGDTEDFEGSPIADNHAVDDSDFADVVTVSIDLGGGTLSESVDVNVAGTASTKTVDKGDNGSFDLNSVKVKSTGIVQ